MLNQPVVDTLSAAGRDFPRGRISEITGSRSSGRTGVLHALLAASTGQGEFAALVDTKDSFDACSAATVGVELSKLVWIRCGGNAEHALRAADLLIQAGGFGVVALDLAEVPPAALNRIPAHRLVPLPASGGIDANDPDSDRRSVLWRNRVRR